MAPLFLYGTLRHEGLRELVAGSALPGQRAVLKGMRAVTVFDRFGRNQRFPMLWPDPDAAAEGIVTNPDPTQRARLDAYEALADLVRQEVVVETDGKRIAAEAYLPKPGTAAWQPGPQWDFAAWEAHFASLALATAAEVMALWPKPGLEAMRYRYPMAEIAAASVERARKRPLRAELRRRSRPDDVVVVQRSRPWTGFFAVEEDALRFRHHTGGMSAPVRRAGFVMGDAVTVLPWDPARDLVLVVEQFRFGPFLRGDPNPWSLEAIAGRIDVGETPEEAARREAAEEAGLTLGALHPVAGYYPSPAAISEWVMSYVAEVDLAACGGGVFGVAQEAEDIRTHVIPFATLLDLIEAGEVENAPLILSAFWLAQFRLKGKAAR